MDADSQKSDLSSQGAMGTTGSESDVAKTHWPLQLSLRMQPRPRLSVLIFHRVLAHTDALRPGEPTAQAFEHRMRWVKQNFNVLPLLEAAQAMRRNALPRRALAITFDDGYADNYTLAAPILKRLGLHATFFVATSFLDGGLMFNDAVIEAIGQAPAGPLDLTDLSLGQYSLGERDSRLGVIGQLLDRVKYLPLAQRQRCVDEIAKRAGAQLPHSLMMSSEQVAELHAMGMGVGAHTHTHPILTRVCPSAACQEVEQGREVLQRLIGAPVKAFAYPNGRPGRDYGPEHVTLVRELGFELAVSTARGAACGGDDFMQIPRFTPWDQTDWRYGLRMAQTLMFPKALKV